MCALECVRVCLCVCVRVCVCVSRVPVGVMCSACTCARLWVEAKSRHTHIKGAQHPFHEKESETAETT